MSTGGQPVKQVVCRMGRVSEDVLGSGEAAGGSHGFQGRQRGVTECDHHSSPACVELHVIF